MKSVIIGAGTYGEVYLSYLVEAGVEVVGFWDDNQDLAGKMVRGVPVLGAIALLNDLQQAHGVEAVYCPIGNNGLRVKVLTQAQELGYKTPNFIHHSVEIASSVKIGEYGIYLLPSTVVMPWSEINDFVMVSVNTVISHHTVVEKGVFLSFGVNLGASIHVQHNAYVGIGATIMTGVKELGEDCFVGAGAVVIKDVPARAIVAGVPAKVLKYK